jgi:hypothetical protein
MENITVYGVHETIPSNRNHKKLVCLFQTEKAARGYAALLEEFELGVTDGEPIIYVVEKWIC